MSDIGVGEYVPIARQRSPRHPAVINLVENRTTTYGELDERSNRLANGLRWMGLSRGDRLACWLATSTRYLELYVAAAKAGVVLVPLNERYTAEEAQHILDDAEPRALLFDDTMAERASEAGRGIKALHLDQLADDPSAAPIRPAPPLDAPLLIGYTSGTTGRPKGAVLTHRSILAINRSNALAYRLLQGSVGIFTGSMSFTATVPAFLLTHLYVGGTIVITGTRDPERTVDAIATYGGNYLAVPPPMVLDYAEVFARRRRDLDSIVSVLQSAGPANPEHLGVLNEALDGRLLLGWGMTENSGGLATVTSPMDMRTNDPAVLRSVGRAVPGCGIRVDEQGELSIGAPSLMAGYWHGDDAVVDGWYRTGDIGTIDEDGTVTLSDRRTDLIVSGGMNVYPSEVERVLRELPGIADCVVVGIPHERWGRAVAAAVVTAPGHSLTEDDVVGACRSRLASYKKPTSIVFVDRLPRTIGDKVHRPSVVELFIGR